MDDSTGEGGSSTEYIDTPLRLLSNPLCRHVLTELAAQPSNYLPYDELVASYVESHSEPVDPETVQIECHHALFPTLSEAGLIEYDEKSGDVRYYSDSFVEEVLDVVDRWEG